MGAHWLQEATSLAASPALRDGAGCGRARDRQGKLAAMETSFASAVVILLLVTDPIGNIPLFVSLRGRSIRNAASA